MNYYTLFEFEQAVANYTGAPYVVATDGCTHAIELCLRLDCVTHTEFTAFTYLSIPQLMRKLNIAYQFKPDYWTHAREYQFSNTNIWDSARRFESGMYRPGQKQCLSFGNGKPLEIGKCGAILLDNETEYRALSCMRSDGRDLGIVPWTDQKIFKEGYHYCPTLEACQIGLEKLARNEIESKYFQYPDLRLLDFES